MAEHDERATRRVFPERVGGRCARAVSLVCSPFLQDRVASIHMGCRNRRGLLCSVLALETVHGEAVNCSNVCVNRATELRVRRRSKALRTFSLQRIISHPTVAKIRRSDCSSSEEDERAESWLENSAGGHRSRSRLRYARQQ